MFYEKLEANMKKIIILTAMVAVFCAPTCLFADDIIAAPNPWIPDGGRVQTGTLAGGINFMNMPSTGELDIYTLSGNLVTKKQFSNISGTLPWSGQNDAGTYVASGVYFWVVKSSAATKSGKLIVVR
jgi:hypothetical protein